MQTYYLLALVLVSSLLSAADFEASNLYSSRKFLSDQSYTNQPISQIAFGSCNKPKKDQGFWDVIRGKNPDIMLLLGDNQYAESIDPKKLKKAYDELAAIKPYREFSQAIPTFPMWDNHDYGAKYPGRLHPHAEESEALFLEHFAIPKSDIRQKRDGVYGTWIFGKKPHRVQVILLDLQRFRDPFIKGRQQEQFIPQTGKTLMGSTQWKWFEKQVKKEAEVRLIGSAIQVLSNEHEWRRWGMFPDERERLLLTLANTTGTSLLLSGDRHRGEISVLNPDDRPPLFDITASSFNHCYPTKEKNSLRVGALIDQPHFAYLNIDWEKGEIKMQLLSSTKAEPLLTNILKITP